MKDVTSTVPCKIRCRIREAAIALPGSYPAVAEAGVMHGVASLTPGTCSK